jgi:hypothetical protein
MVTQDLKGGKKNLKVLTLERIKEGTERKCWIFLIWNYLTNERILFSSIVSRLSLNGEKTC